MGRICLKSLFFWPNLTSNILPIRLQTACLFMLHWLNHDFSDLILYPVYCLFISKQHLLSYSYFTDYRALFCHIEYHFYFVQTLFCNLSGSTGNFPFSFPFHLQLLSSLYQCPFNYCALQKVKLLNRPCPKKSHFHLLVLFTVILQLLFKADRAVLNHHSNYSD